jgi:hypothetical protein
MGPQSAPLAADPVIHDEARWTPSAGGADFRSAAIRFSIPLGFVHCERAEAEREAHLIRARRLVRRTAAVLGRLCRSVSSERRESPHFAQARRQSPRARASQGCEQAGSSTRTRTIQRAARRARVTGTLVARSGGGGIIGCDGQTGLAQRPSTLALQQPRPSCLR